MHVGNALGRADQTAASQVPALVGQIDQTTKTLLAALSHLRDIHSRVVPPTPEPAGAGPTPVARTYEERLTDLGAVADRILSVAQGLDGRI